MKIKFVLYCLFAFAFGFSQTHKATISDVKKDGFHNITISPEVRSASKDNLDCFRILDKSKKEVPYVVVENLNRIALHFKKVTIVNKSTSKDSISRIIITDLDLKNNTELILHIANSNIDKTYSISGSNNQKDWYGLVSNQILSDLNNEKETSVRKTILIPKNNYKFLRIDFNDKKSLPINVFDIGYYKDKESAVETTYLKEFKYKISEDKKNKKTIITFSSENFQRVDKISFDVKTKLFSRNASVFVNKKRKVKKRTENFKQEISNFNLASNTSNLFHLNNFFEKVFTIEIDNKDNQPLEISNIKVLQNAISVVADLKANEKYDVIIDTTLTQPQYDLANFTQKFNSDLPLATITNLQKLDKKTKEDTDKAFWQQPVFLWSSILIALGLLAYFVFSMLKDVEKN
ncbi:hypothetical protein SAMN05444005_10418 [Flavobacterium urocaniciphilum]|uniref:Oxygen tolerance n=2 Tax=Flavobacterium urocaniciphilum TaxID=1299341 RepID=A0A1H9C2D6_9FLAO|nr:hypothetical protein SAMN05444005_10418 [Flavobacterium urocaniciphilum]